MKIALGQLDMVWEDKAASLKKAEIMLKTAAAAEADVILFPEMSLTGFSMDVNRIGEPEGESDSVKRMQELAKEYGISIGFGWSALPEAGQDKGTNRFTFIDEGGQVLGEYCKLHPFRFGKEGEHYRRGDELVTVDYQGRTLGLFICYDLRFPEIFQIVSRKADILLVIANWPESRREHWTTLLRARAIENQAYVVGVNCAGERDGIKYSGDSMVVNPLGEVLGSLSGQEGILLCEIGDEAAALRERFPLKSDRREEFYAQYMCADGGKDE